ncbi:MAG: PA2778 family cysteine peptidase [Halioglobus sp.]|nr:PA2778 family cysteine peptidase [Halioglobus sp.]
MLTLLSALSAAGCSVNPTLRLEQITSARFPLHLDAVPFFAQTDYQCGPAALAGVLGASGVDTGPDELSPQVYLPGRRGSLQPELLAATRRAGRVPYLLDPAPANLIAQLEAARPVLVFQNVRTPSFPQWHYAVLTGVDAATNRVYLNSGTNQSMDMPAGAFLRTWNWAERWAMVALRPGELPAQPDRQRYMQAVTDFEAVAGTPRATPAWRAAMRRWPRDARPYLALGNAAYAGGDLLVAIDYYRRGLQVRPGEPVLSNNLAALLGELGCPASGLLLLRPVAEGLEGNSSWGPVIDDTLAELTAAGRSEAGYCALLEWQSTIGS